MEQSPSINSSIRTLMILIGGIGVSKGWWSEAGLVEMVDYFIVWGGATLALVGAAWGIRAKWPTSGEAKVIAADVVEKTLSPAEANFIVDKILEPTEPT
jgi:hypothetical protein